RSVAFIFMPRSALWRQKQWLAATAAICAVLILMWWIPARGAGEYWTHNWLLWNTTAFGWPRYQEALSTLRDLPWFLWPTWPFALLAVWRWRSWLTSPHMWIPLMFAAMPLATMVFQVDAFEPEYSLVALPAAVLAAFSLPPLRR